MAQQEYRLETNIAEAVLANLRVKRDFPREGVSFLDFNKCFCDSNIVSSLVSNFLSHISLSKDDLVLAPEARGFILGPVIANTVGCSFIPLRKKGKLPDFGNLRTEFYGTEYSDDAISLDLDLALKFKNRKVLIYDDVLATGGTAKAALKLASLFEPSEVNLCFLAEILSLEGSKSLGDNLFYSLLKF